MSQRIIKSSILVFLVSACTLGVEENVKQDLAFFPIEEAELVYNQTIAPTRSFSSRKSARISMLYCGDFTADWTRAESSSDSEVSAYSVPVNSEYRLYSYKKNKEHVVKRPWRRVQQDLYVYKKYNGSTGAAIRSIIKRHGLKKTEKFSGVVAYSDLNTGNIFRTEEFKDGVIQQVMEVNNDEEVLPSIKKIGELLKDYAIARKHTSTLRDDDEEDEWEDFWQWWYMIETEMDYFEDWMWFCTEDFTWWYDSDRDGYPDYQLPDYNWQAFFSVIDQSTQGNNIAIGTNFTPATQVSYTPNHPYVLASQSYSWSGQVIQYFFSGASLFSSASYLASRCGNYRSQADAKSVFEDQVYGITSAGVSPYSFSPFIRHVFNTTKLYSRSAIRSSIDSGRVVFSFVNDNQDPRAVVIIGYNPTDGTLLYVDGQTGLSYKEPYNQLLPLLSPALSVFSINNFEI